MHNSKDSQNLQEGKAGIFTSKLKLQPSATKHLQIRKCLTSKATPNRPHDNQKNILEPAMQGFADPWGIDKPIPTPML